MRPVLLAALVLGSSLRAADPAEQLTKLNVSAVDAHGQPVTDLTAADFQITDDGKPQPIVFFRYTAGKPAQTELGPREYSNRSPVQRPPIVILFDMLNDRLMGDAVIRGEMVDALKNLEQSENIYLYLLTPRGELFPVHPLPRPDTVLKPETEPWTRQIAPILDQALKPFIGFHQVDELDPKNRYQETIAALSDLGGQMTEASSPRYLIWVTHGMPIFAYSMSVRGRLDFTDPLRNFFGRLGLSQILVYPVDQSRRGAGADPTSYSTQTLDEAAELTGGRRLTSDRVGDAVTQTMADLRANYEISYASPWQKVDKKRHKIHVTTTRKEVRVQSMQAYYVLPAPAAQDAQRATFESDIHSPFRATDIGVRVSITPTADSKSFNINIFVDPADLLLKKAGENRTGHIDVMLAGYSAEGFDQASKPMPFNFNLTTEQYETGMRGGLAIHQGLSVKPSTERVRVVVYDPALNASGSVDVPLKP
jgi:VWFA-related protein